MRAIIRQFGLTAGLAEGDDPKQNPPGTLGVLENSVWRKIGRVDKRFGTAYLGAVASTAKRLFTRGDELCMVDGSHVYAQTTSGWIDRGMLPEVGLTWSVAHDTMAGAKSADVAYAGAFRQTMHAWVTGDPQDETVGGSVYAQITDEDGVIITAPTLIFSGDVSRVRIVTDGSIFIVLWVALGNLYAWSSGTQTTLRTDVHNPVIGKYTFNAFDACVIGVNFVVAYALSGGGIKLASFTMATTPVAVTTGVVTGEASQGIVAISVAGASGAELYILYAEQVGGNVRRALADPSTLAQTVAPLTLETQAGMPSPNVGVLKLTTGALFAFSYGAPKGILYAQFCDAAGSTGGLLSASFKRLLSRPFTLGTRQYAYATDYLTAGVFLSGNTIFGADTFLVDVTCDALTSPTPIRQVGKVELLTGGRWYIGQVSNVIAPSSEHASAVLPFTGDAAALQNPWRQGLRAVEATIGDELPDDMWRPASIGPETYLSAGVLTAYDGAAALPYGWAHPAYLDWSTTAVVAGGSLADGNYTYNTVPERRSAAGVLHRGPTAIAQTKAALAPNSKINVSITPVHLTYGVEDGYVTLYRSIVNFTDQTLHRLSKPPTFAIAQNTAAFTFTIADGTSDTAAALSSRPAIYTAGGELDDFQPPACTTHVLHRNRLFVLSGDEQTVFVSKDASSNVGTAPGFHPDVRLYFPERMRALTSMDEKFIAFSETRPWYVLGDGPAPNGLGSDFTEPTPIQTDVGCTNPRSVVATPDGIMFLSQRGFTLLSRGLEVAFIGAAVDDTLEDFPDVTSGVLVASQNQVRWTCNAADGLTGRVIVFDYVTKQWSVFRYRDVYGAITDTPIADALMWKGAWTFVTPTGKVYSETETSYLDAGSSWVTSRGATTWMSEGGPLGFQHIRRAFLLGDQYTPCSLKLSFGFAHADAYAQTYTWDSAALDAMEDGINVGMRVGSQNGASPRTRAFRIAWEDGPPLEVGEDNQFGTGQGFNLSAIGIEFIPKPDMDRRSAKART